MWVELESKSSFVHAHSAGKSSALEMTDHIILKDKKCTLTIQREMTAADSVLSDTTV